MTSLTKRDLQNILFLVDAAVEVIHEKPTLGSAPVAEDMEDLQEKLKVLILSM